MTFLPLTLHAWSFLQNDLKCEHRFRRYRSSKYHILSFGQLYCWSFGLYIGSFVRCTRNSFTVRPDMTNNVDLSRCFPDRSTYVRERAFNKDLLCRGGIKVNTATSIMFWSEPIISFGGAPWQVSDCRRPVDSLSHCMIEKVGITWSFKNGWNSV